MEYADIYIGNQKKEFFTVPCFYLTQEGSRKFISMDIKNRDKIFFNLYLLGKGKDLIQNFAPSSSVMIIRRSHYLSIGGHRPEFKGHGYEDFELIHRLLVYLELFQEAKIIIEILRAGIILFLRVLEQISLY